MSIDLKHVSYTYMPKTPFEHTALEDISLSVKEGEILALVGHTGSGKSTLLQVLSGLLSPTHGDVCVDGISLHGKTCDEKKNAKTAAAKIGMVFQYAEHQLFEETVFQEIAFGPRNHGLSEEEVERCVARAMQLVGLSEAEFRDKSPFQLSGGQMRRVAIAGILSMNSKYLLLDEPTVGLDAAGKERLLSLLERLHEKQGITMVLVTHNMDDVARLADHVAVLQHGRLLLLDSMQKVFQERELLKKANLGLPSVVSFLEKLREAGVPVHAEAMTMKGCVEEILRAVKERGKDTACCRK